MIAVARKLGRRVAHWGWFAQTALLAGALLVSAMGMAVATTSSTFGWVGWIALLPLFQAIRVLTPASAGFAGAFWGACLFGAASQMGGAAFRADLFGFALLAIVPGVYAAFGASLTRSIGFSPYLLALGWVGVEFTLHPIGLHNGLLAGAVGDGFALRVVGSFTGYVLIAFVIAYINAAILCVLTKIQSSVSTTRFCSGGSDGIRGVVHRDGFVPLFAFILEIQPRGPPAPAFVSSTQPR